ncbi:hypothetical protein TNCV_4762261 [Trichonephila clavipes]|nr:hypothetical protein TNCV_4762261 [Trichonephila clavipes]
MLNGWISKPFSRVTWMLSELIAIRRGIQYACETEVQFQNVWILTDSRASVQHLSNWTSIGDQTSLDILKWVPSYVGIDGNEKAFLHSVNYLPLRRLNSILLEELFLVILVTSEEIQEVHSTLCLGNTGLPPRAFGVTDSIRPPVKSSFRLPRIRRTRCWSCGGEGISGPPTMGRDITTSIKE